jgi:hypothetical protein
MSGYPLGVEGSQQTTLVDRVGDVTKAHHHLLLKEGTPQPGFRAAP